MVTKVDTKDIQSVSDPTQPLSKDRVEDPLKEVKVVGVADGSVVSVGS